MKTIKNETITKKNCFCKIFIVIYHRLFFVLSQFIFTYFVSPKKDKANINSLQEKICFFHRMIKRISVVSSWFIQHANFSIYHFIFISCARKIACRKSEHLESIFFVIIFLCIATNVKISQSESETWIFAIFFLIFLLTFFPKVIFFFFMLFFFSCVTRYRIAFN